MTSRLSLSMILKDIASRNKITLEDVLLLRRSVYEDGISSRHEVEDLLILQSNLGNTPIPSEWQAFLTETVCDFLVYQEKPQGYVNSDNLAWLLGIVACTGKVETRCEIEILLKVLEATISVPEVLGEFILKQVEDTVITAQGPLAPMGMKKGQITKEHTDIVRRVLYAMGGAGNVAITQEEAEAVFSINDKSVHAYTAPEWNELFVKVIANYMLSISGYTVPSREKALKHEEFLGSTAANIGGFMSSILLGSLKEKLKIWTQKDHQVPKKTQEAEHISLDEVSWLSDRIHHEGELHANERALIEFLKAENSDLHPDLMTIIHKKVS